VIYAAITGGVKTVAQMKKKHIDIPFIGPDGLWQRFLAMPGQCRRVYATGPMDVGRYPLTSRSAAYLKKYGHERDVFDQGAAAWQALIAAIRRLVYRLRRVGKGVEGEPGGDQYRQDQVDARGDAEGAGFAVYQVRAANSPR